MHPRIKSSTLLTLALCAAQLVAAAEAQLLPAGKFSPVDGRQIEWELTDEAGKALAARLTKSATQNKFAFDFEHQMVNAADNGQPAPASGWASKFEWRDGVGLFAIEVEWTARAKQMIEAGEYKYISPVIIFNQKTKEITGIYNAALVNTPALAGMAEVARLAASRFAQHQSNSNDETDDPQESLMLKLVIAALGLQAAATEDEALTALNALKVKAEGAETQVAALKSTHDTALATANTAIAALKTELDTHKNATAKAEKDALIAEALKSGKLIPALKDWAESIDLATLKGFVEKAAAVTPGQQTDDAAGKNTGDMTPADVAGAALKYQTEQQAIGKTVSTAQAVDHVIKTRAA